MARTKLDEMRSLIKRAEKAEAKLTKREMENIENGRKARAILDLIEEKTDEVIDVIAEAYAAVPTSKVDQMLADFVDRMNDLIEKTAEEDGRKRMVKAKKVESEAVNVVDNSTVLNQEVTSKNDVLSPENVTKFVQNQALSVANAGANMQPMQANNVSNIVNPNMNAQAQMNPQSVNYQTGGIKYDVQ